MIYLSLLVVGGLLTPCFATSAPTPDDFDDAVRSSGPAYQDARNRLLRPEVDIRLISAKLSSQSPRDRLTAKIVLGWREHEQEYTKLLGRFLTDITGEKRYPWAYDPGAIKPEWLPLMYEFLAKEVGGGPGRDAAVRVINYLARQGTDVDVGALTGLLREGGTPETSRAAVARAVSALPQSMIKPDDLFALLKHESSLQGANKDVAGALMNGLIQRGSALSEQGKDDVVGQLLKMDNLKNLVGETAVVTTAGGIGGRVAASRVAEFLNGADQPAQRRWAISTLGSIGDETAVRSLTKAALNDKLPDPERVYVTNQLSKVAYTDEVGKTLEAIIRSGDRTDRHRTEAISTLEKLHQANLRNGPAERDLRSRLERLDPSSAPSDELKGKMRDAKLRLERLPASQ